MPTVYLTSQLLARMQRKLSIGTTEDVFTDEELDDIYLEAEFDFNKSLVIAIDEILMDLAKLHNYSAGQTKENKSEVFDHLYKVRSLALANAQSGAQVLIVGIRGVPPRKIARPVEATPIANPKGTSPGAVVPNEDTFGLEFGPENDNQ